MLSFQRLRNSATTIIIDFSVVVIVFLRPALKVTVISFSSSSFISILVLLVCVVFQSVLFLQRDDDYSLPQGLLSVSH